MPMILRLVVTNERRPLIFKVNQVVVVVQPHEPKVLHLQSKLLDLVFH